MQTIKIVILVVFGMIGVTALTFVSLAYHAMWVDYKHKRAFRAIIREEYPDWEETSK